VAFGSTKRAKNAIENDQNIRYLLEAETPVVAIFGKSWILHVEKALRITPAENLKIDS
jgi:2-isopropylmalate synthase